MARLEKTDVRVLIPAYNEADHLPGLLSRVKERGYPLLVVDDGSEDGTVETVRKLGFEVLALRPNRGKGAALREGIRYLLPKGQKAVIFMDADGQHDPEELDLFLAALGQERSDMIIGNRMHRARNMPWLRKLTNRFMSFLISLLAGQKVPDSQCGYRAAKTEVLRALPLHTDHYEIESEMILEAARRGFYVRSVPVRSVYTGSISKIRPGRDTVRFFAFLFGFLKQRPPKNKN